MSMGYTKIRRSKRETAWIRALLIVAALVLFAGLFVQITMLSRISSQSKQAAKLEKEIVELSASAENLEVSINQYHNLETIGDRARELGMEEPVDDQLRVVNLPQVVGDTSTQTVANSEGEKISG